MLPVLAAALATASSMTWLVVPLVSYNSDDGLAGGAAGQVQWVGDVRPYRAALGAQVLFTTAGVQSHYFRLDVPRLFGSSLRMWLSAEFHRELTAPYYGLGNQSSDDLADHPGITGPHAFAYQRRFPLGLLAFTLPFGDSGLRFSTFARFLHTKIDLYPGSLLATEQPPGTGGGDELSYGFGVFLDRRDKEVVPTRGYLLEAATRGSVAGFASDQSYAGATARALGFLPVGSRIVLASRIEGDILTAGTPLFELSRFGGIDPVEGVGGERSVRGLPKARFVGRGKALATAELRVKMLDKSLFERIISFGLVAFVDTGRVWQLNGNDGDFFDLHTAAGGGLRVWQDEFLLRFDVGTSAERAVNVYLTFGNFF
ncbi:MAG: Omp85 family outer membrane protein [Myxococcales bacterium]